jgi:hypothetical protein
MDISTYKTAIETRKKNIEHRKGYAQSETNLQNTAQQDANQFLSDIRMKYRL